MSEVRLVYFDIRGFAEPVRWMLCLAGQEFEDERIPLDVWAAGKKRSSFDRRGDKESKRKSMDGSKTIMRFKEHIGQLPILYFDDIVLTQTLAVLRFIARKYGYTGNSQLEEARADEVADLVYDIRLCAVAYQGSGFKSKTPDIVRHTVFRDFNGSPETPGKAKMRDDLRLIYLPLYLSKFSQLMVEAGGKFVAGQSLTYGDLVLVNFLEIVIEMLDPNCLDEFPNLKDLLDRVLAMPAIDEWRTSQKAAVADFGGEEAG